MAHINLLDPFKKELRDMVVYTLAEFGATSVKRFNKELDDIKHRLMLHPLSSPREPFLSDSTALTIVRLSRRIGRLSIATTKPTTSSFS